MQTDVLPSVISRYSIVSSIVWIITISLVSSFFLFNFISSRIFAQVPGIEPGETNEQPKTRSSVVTASVPDIVPPSAPILVSPLNSAVLTNNQVSFVFTGSTDNVGIDHYQFWLDGVLTYANLNPSGEITTQYSLTVIGNQFTLLPALAQTDGDHTWKVVALDAAGNLANSATWQYSVDSQAPTFLITSIDGQVYSISAQDLLTIPTTAIPVASAEPILSGLGEVNSTGVVSVSISGQATQLITFSISSAGVWQIQLPSIPYDTTVWLNFTITDPAGNVSVLSDLPLIRPSTPVIVATPTVGVISGTPSPTIPLPPIIGPVMPSPPFPALPLPLPSLPFPLPSPFQPIVEQVTRLSQAPRVLLAQMMPVSTMASWQEPSISIFQLILPILSILNWLWLILPILITLLWVSRFLPQAFTRQGFKQLWWAIDFRRDQEPRGAVFLMPSLQPLAFASLTVISKLSNGQTLVSYRLTNQWGEYLPMNLPLGNHTISINTPGTLFPAVFNVPAHTLFSTYYLGEEWIIDSTHQEPYLLIPVLKTDQKPRHNPPGWLLKLTHQQGKTTGGQLALVALTVILLPSLLNLAAFIVLIMLVLKAFVSKRRSETRLAEVYNRNQEVIHSGALILHSNTDNQVQVVNKGFVRLPIKQSLLSGDKQWSQAVVVNDQVALISEKPCSINDKMLVI